MHEAEVKHVVVCATVALVLGVASAGCATTPCTDTDAAAGTTTTWHEHGVCYRALRCCEDRDCATGFECSPSGRCTAMSPRMCGCNSDRDCGGLEIHCVANDAVCGACVARRPLCDAGTPCSSGETCVDGYCADDTRCIDARIGF